MPGHYRPKARTSFGPMYLTGAVKQACNITVTPEETESGMTSIWLHKMRAYQWVLFSGNLSPLCSDVAVFKAERILGIKFFDINLLFQTG